MKRQHDVAMDDAGAALATTVLCCSCGVPMVPNQTMRCAQCLKSEVSIVDGISRQVVLPHCRNCNRYQKPPWVNCEPESRELLGVCLKRLKGLGKELRLVDASFIWTEEHSRRIKVKITVQKEIASASVLQQTMVIEYQVINQQCDECKRSFTPHTFNAIVQVRQKVAHRRTFCWLEQLILKHDAHDKVVSLRETREGLDFHFGQRSHAQRFADFVASYVPLKQRNSKHLQSHDANSNVYQYKYTLALDLCPVCADDVVHVPKGHSAALSGAPSLLICHKVSNCLRLIDPLTLRGFDISSAEFWKRPLESVGTRSLLTEYVVLNVEHVEAPQIGTPAKHHLAGRGKMQLADVEIARASDFGVNDERLIVRSHLGHILRPGSTVLGYDLRTINLSGLSEPVEDVKADVFLVRRQYKRKRGRARQWELKRLERDVEDGQAAQALDDADDVEAVCKDLEEDPELRRHVNLYRSEVPEKKKSAERAAAPDGAGGEGNEEDEDEDEDAPEVPLAELLEGLKLQEEDGTPGPSS